MRKTIVLVLAAVIAIFALAVWTIDNDASSIDNSAFEPRSTDGDDAAPTIELLMERGRLAMANEEWERAHEFFEMVLDIDYEHAPAHIWRIRAELRINNEVNLAQSVRQGDVIQFGGYNWRVLDVQNNRALIITENIIESRIYNAQQASVTWETSTLRRYLNDEFLQKFTREDQARIAETRIRNQDNQWYGINGGNDTTDRIFLLSLEELVRYFGDSGQLSRPRRGIFIFRDQYNSVRIVEDADGTVSPWWLRSPGLSGFHAAFVSYNGDVFVSGKFVNLVGNGVRPALWLNL